VASRLCDPGVCGAPPGQPEKVTPAGKGGHGAAVWDQATSRVNQPNHFDISSYRFE